MYHNHEHEAEEKVNGEPALFYLLKNTNPDYVGLELDVYWAQYGGVNPIEIMEQFSGRIPILHIKDGDLDKNNRGHLRELGQGRLYFEHIFELVRKDMSNSAIEWLVYEQDGNFRVNSLRSAFDSMQWLRKEYYGK